MSTNGEKLDLEARELNDLGRMTADALVDWYWEHGIKRLGPYAISPVWLNNLYKRRDLLHSIEIGRANKKASVGLWGP